MKKILLALALGCVFLAFAGCSLLGAVLPGGDTEPTTAGEPASLSSQATAEPSAEATATAEPTAEPTLSPDELLDTLRVHLDLINQCYAETCGAELGDTPYSRVYTSAQAMLDGEAPIDVVEQSTIDRSNPTDPTDATLYEILNFKTNAEALAYLEQYMAPDVAEALFPNEFLEMNGKLYMVYGSRGYGADKLDLDSAAISVSGDTCTVTLDLYRFEEKVGTCTVSFEKQGENWIITAIDGGAA